MKFLAFKEFYGFLRKMRLPIVPSGLSSVKFTFKIIYLNFIILLIIYTDKFVRTAKKG